MALRPPTLALRSANGWKDGIGETWNAALAALALLSKNQTRKTSPPQRQAALEQLWRNQASLLTNKHFAQAINAFGRHRRWQEGSLLLQEMSRRKLGPCKYCYSALISACAVASAWQKAVQVLTEPDAGFEVDLIAISSGLSACEKASRWEEAVSLCSEADGRRLQLDLVAFNQVISSCGKGFAWPMSLAFFQVVDSMLTPNLVTFSSAVSACERGQQWQRALCLLSDARKQGLRLDSIMLGASISACEKGRQWENALSLLKQAGQWHVVCDSTSFNAAMAALGKSFLWQRALELLKAVPAPDVVSFDAALDAAALVSQWTQVLALLKDMQKHLFSPTDFSFMSALSACTTQKQWQKALSLYDTLQKDRPANALLRLTLLDALEEAQNWQQALQLLVMDDTDVALYLGCIRLLVRTEQLEIALQIYGMLEESGKIKPWISEWELDLHGFTLEAAYVASSYALLRSRGRLCLVVGRGRGSDLGTAVLPQLLEILPVHDIREVPWNPGRLLISSPLQ